MARAREDKTHLMVSHENAVRAAGLKLGCVDDGLAHQAGEMSRKSHLVASRHQESPWPIAGKLLRVRQGTVRRKRMLLPLGLRRFGGRTFAFGGIIGSVGMGRQK
jgi:hypothetical protein